MKRETGSPPLMLTRQQTADALGVSVRTVDAWLTDGRLASVMLGGSRRIRRQDVERVCEAGIPAGGAE